jgi:glycosyltransferase involved in cell wall biosynthesis
MDLYPEALAAHGLLRESSVGFSLLSVFARWQHRGAAFVLAPGPCVARRLQAYTHDLVPTWVPLWSDGGPCPAAAAAACRRGRGWPDGELVLMYSGNMGLGHRFGEFLDAAARLGPGGPRWAFAGGGARREAIEAFARAHPEARIDLLPYVPRSELPASLGAADVHLVSLSRAWQGLIVPSKLQGIFAASRPALFVGPEDNEVARWIRESGGGWVVAEDDVSGLLSAIDDARDPVERERRGQAALEFARERFDRDRNLATVARLVEHAASG